MREALEASHKDKSDIPIDPVILAAATNQPQIVETLVQLLPDYYTLETIRENTLALEVACAVGALDFLKYWTTRFGSLPDAPLCLNEALSERREDVIRWLLKENQPWRDELVESVEEDTEEFFEILARPWPSELGPHEETARLLGLLVFEIPDFPRFEDRRYMANHLGFEEEWISDLFFRVFGLRITLETESEVFPNLLGSFSFRLRASLSEVSERAARNCSTRHCGQVH